MSLDREQWIMRPSKHKLRKNDKRFSFFKTAYFPRRGHRKSSKILIENGVSKKRQGRFRKSRRQAILPCIYLNFEIFNEN